MGRGGQGDEGRKSSRRKKNYQKSIMRRNCFQNCHVLLRLGCLFSSSLEFIDPLPACSRLKNIELPVFVFCGDDPASVNSSVCNIEVPTAIHRSSSATASPHPRQNHYPLSNMVRPSALPVTLVALALTSCTAFVAPRALPRVAHSSTSTSMSIKGGGNSSPISRAAGMVGKVSHMCVVQCLLLSSLLVRELHPS